MKKVSLFLLAFLLSALIHAQENMFVIYSVKGTVTVIENKAETKAKIGTIINENATIRVDAGSFATLLCNEQRMFSLKKPGNYNPQTLKDSCAIKGGSFTSNYIKYVWNEMTKSKGTPEKNRKYFMKNVGAVSRGGINNVWIDPRLDTILYVSGTIPLSWKSYADADEFEFKLYNPSENNKVIVAKTTSKKHVDISDLIKDIQPGHTYEWTAMIKGEPDNEDKKFLRYVTKDEYNKFYNWIKTHDAAENEAELNFRLGFTLEENHYLAEAYNHYLKATQLAPDNSLYRFTFMSFKKDFEIK